MEVSNFGRIKSFHGKKERILKPILVCGYLSVSLSINKKVVGKRIHRLVAKEFLNNPENKPEVNHINGVKTDNMLHNLEWCTGKENIYHACSHKLMNGIKHRSSKLTEKQVIQIRKRYISHIYTLENISDEYGISTRAAFDILHRVSYKFIL
ncbi:MAG: NUMOD4 motif-containing HNH endonuclease [Candidatus Roizmanbacteria bacterium]|nr:NUMOD4 motif-containing HNH endonuclease [Candidatus Roizmanbacteria bacterium]